MLIKMNDITKVYHTDEVETTALNKVNIEIKKGEFVAVMGPSGCGKSTLLNIIGMLDNPSSGNFFFLDEDIAGYSESKLADIRKQNIGFIFQSFNLIDELTVQENIELALLYHSDVSAKERKERVVAVMERMGIAHRAGHMPSQLSGGQQQRVAVARAVVANPHLILADEGGSAARDRRESRGPHQGREVELEPSLEENATPGRASRTDRCNGAHLR